jgi:phage terminase small subunit
MSELTPKQQRFVEEYLTDLNATKAAERAGYSKKTANPQASRLLANVNVQEAITNAKNKRSERTEIDQDWVINKLVENLEASMAEKNRPAANKALELLGRHLNIFTDRLEVKQEFCFADLWRIARSRISEQQES